MKTIGIIGYGIIGKVLADWIRCHTTHTIKISDPDKGFDDSLLECEAIFISIHIPTDRHNQQDLSVLNIILSKIPNVPIFLRSTVLPGTSDRLSKIYERSIYFFPEFLSERTAEYDFNNQTLVFTGEYALLQHIFPSKNYIICTNFEAELAKYAHNVFGALKVTYFNGINDICKANNSSFSTVREIMLMSAYINSTHTFVPGHDGLNGYGGKCFPKDVNSFLTFVKDYDLIHLIKNLSKLNDKFRNT